MSATALILVAVLLIALVVITKAAKLVIPIIIVLGAFFFFQSHGGNIQEMVNSVMSSANSIADNLSSTTRSVGSESFTHHPVTLPESLMT